MVLLCSHDPKQSDIDPMKVKLNHKKETVVTTLF